MSTCPLAILNIKSRLSEHAKGFRHAITGLCFLDHLRTDFPSLPCSLVRLFLFERDSHLARLINNNRTLVLLILVRRAVWVLFVVPLPFPLLLERKAVHEPHQIPVRIGLAAAGALLLLGYGTALNLAPVEFARVAGLYIAVLFVVWQVVNFIVFRGVPTLPIYVGGALIVTGGLIVTYWRTG